MDEYQHMERFGMENDYEDGQWIGGEFYYKKRKEKRSQTKKEVLYGVFDESDSDAEESSSKRYRRDVIKKGDLTKPVNFVSTGTVMPSEEIDKKADEKNDGDESRPGLGTNAGLGFQENETRVEEHEHDFLPTAFGRIIKEGVERRERERERSKTSVGKARDTAGSGVGNGMIGTFEKHTKGIGMKLLEKMGYKGGGLGKNEQGIAVPIEAKLRPKNMGMGFNDYNESGAGVPTLPAMEERDEKVKEVKPRTKEKLWLKQNRDKKKDYVTAEELLAQKQEQGVEVVQKVLDMRGPQVRVLTNLENLNAEQKAIEDQTPMPELQHNVKLIVDMAEADIQRFDRSLRHERESVAIYQKEKERLQKEVARQKQRLGNIEDIMAALDKVRESVASGTMTLESLASVFENLQSTYREDYKMCNLSCIASSFALPLLIRVFQGWEPLQHPLHGLEVMTLWQRLLQGDEPRDYGIYTEAELGTSTPYTQLFTEIIFPAVRIAATNSWEPRDPEPMLRFLETWEKLLPVSVLHNILENIVMPKLTAAVDSWDPRRETVPIHAWLHPWLPLLGNRMEPLYHPIRYKLGNVLHAWHASDASAYAILSPWKTVFDPASWEQLIVRFIVPKLMAVLQEFTIDPASQQLDQFYWVMAWASAIPIHHMVTMLEAGFFPKWQQVLYHWLCSNPDFDEVTQWFLGWKGLLPPELLANERIRSQLNVGLEMMNQAVEGMTVEQPGARENVSYLRVTEQRQFEALQQQQAAPAAYAQQQTVTSLGSGIHMNNAMGAPQLSLKEVIEAYAQEHDIQFLPKVGRMHDGLQVYGFGTVSVCLDSVKQQVFAQSGDRWVVASLEQLVEMHHSRSGGNH
uniref:G-patch domain-containing protein n=1 Tax=Araucaria cunninghamii TaxID=56994 RepID=A0A0D6QRZ5_ARACU